MTQHSQIFHVVCRDCQMESVVDSEQLARECADEHTTDSDHIVDFEQIA